MPTGKYAKKKQCGAGVAPVTPQQIKKAEEKAEKQVEKRDEEALKVERKKLFQAWRRF
jgi:hypothetical protein